MCDTTYELYSLGLCIFFNSFILMKDICTYVHHSNRFPAPLSRVCDTIFVFFPRTTDLSETHSFAENAELLCQYFKILPVTALVPKALFFPQYFFPQKSHGHFRAFLYARVILNSLKFYQAEISVSATISSQCFL